MTTILQVFESLINSGKLPCMDRINLPARQERTADIPEAYRKGASGRWLMNDDKLQGRVWHHQALAMEAVLQKNIIVSTGTASGKSLIFQSSALHILDADSEATVLVFYPLKALASDQLNSWRHIGDLAGISDNEIVLIDGSVSRVKRANILCNARIALLTPDVCHAWLLQELSNVIHRDFLARIALIVIDEAHTLEGVFGSNFSFLFRRLCIARSLASYGRRRSDLRVVAASATISNPKKHLEDLTGLEFQEIKENEDGSPSYPRSIFHVGAQQRKEAEAVAPYLENELINQSDNGSVIAFIDSRQGAERLAIKSAEQANSIKPYRSGYEEGDRREIENSLRQGSLRGVISTSALELGIDIPHFTIGLNIGVPTSRKSFRQRLGRIGRHQPGDFAIIAEPFAFKRFGTTLMDYYNASVEPSYLYIHNRFMQYAHARCLAEELEMLGMTGRKNLPSSVSWPEGFTKVFSFSYSNSPLARPREFDQVAQIGGDQPHYNYPLRNAPEEVFNIVDRQSSVAGSGSRIGTLSLQQAIREAFPGAIHLHMTNGWRVQEWRNTAFERVIRATRSRSRLFPTPLIRTFVNFSLDRESLIENRYRVCETGFIAECQLQINERVEGYREGDEKKYYKDLRSDNPNMTPKTREFRTSGVVIRIEESWFGAKGVKETIANSLRDLILREYSISPRDVDVSSTNISLIQNGERRAISDAIALFDSTHGSLHLTELAYLQIGDLLDKLARSIDLTRSEGCLISSQILSNLCDWYAKLRDGNIDHDHAIDNVISSDRTGNWYHVFREGSVVAKTDLMGVHRDIEIAGYELLDLGEGPKLFYSYRTDTNGKAMLPMDKATAVGDEWEMVYWNSKTREVRDNIDDQED